MLNSNRGYGSSRSMPCLKWSFQRMGRGVGMIVNTAIVRGRRGFRRIRRLIGKPVKVAPCTSSNSTEQLIQNFRGRVGLTQMFGTQDPEKIPPAHYAPSEETKMLTSLFDLRPSTCIEDLEQLGRLPCEIRKSLYGYLPPNDFSKLRLMNRQFEKDVSSVRGVHAGLSSCYSNNAYRFLSQTGVESLAIKMEWNDDSICVRLREHNRYFHWIPWITYIRFKYNQDLDRTNVFKLMEMNKKNPQKLRKLNLKYPGLLKTLKITGGVISRNNLQYLLQNCRNLEEFEIEFYYWHDSQPGLYNSSGGLGTSERLKTLRVTVFTAIENLWNTAPGPVDPGTVLMRVQDILSPSNCPQLKSFTFIWKSVPDKYSEIEDGLWEDQIHLAVWNFVKAHSLTLKELTLNTRMYNDGSELHRQVIDHLENDDWMSKLQLTEIRLRLNSYFDDLETFLRSQKCLKLFGLEIGFSGNLSGFLQIAVTNCGHTLREIVILKMILKRFLDFGLLFQDCFCLEKLTLQRDQHYSSLLQHTININQLPITLTELSLHGFLLPWNQEFEFFMESRRFKKLELGFWVDSSASLAEFFRNLDALFQTGSTTVESFVLKDFNHRFKNANTEVTEFLRNNRDTIRTQKIQDVEDRDLDHRFSNHITFIYHLTFEMY